MHNPRPLLVEVLHCLRNVHRPRKPLLDAGQRCRCRWASGLPGAARAMEQISEGGVEELSDNPRTVGRGVACAHQLEHEAVALPGEGVELLGEEGGAAGVGV